VRDFQFLNQDFIWTVSNIYRLAESVKSPRFSLAFESFWTVSQQSHRGAALLMAWAGIEAFFSVDSELSFRLALLLSIYLAKNTQEKHELFAKIKSSYRLRSKMVHGSSISNEATLTEPLQTMLWLRECLLKSLTEGKLPDEMELLFGATT
jgi:hypothetical protein